MFEYDQTLNATKEKNVVRKVELLVQNINGKKSHYGTNAAI